MVAVAPLHVVAVRTAATPTYRARWTVALGDSTETHRTAVGLGDTAINAVVAAHRYALAQRWIVM